MQFVKALASSLLLPFQLGLVLLVLGGLLCLAGKKRIGGALVVLVGLALMVLPATGPVSDRLLSPLERQYSPLLTLEALPGNTRPDDLRWIVVLGGGHRAATHVPPGSRLTPSSLSRITEGVRLHKLLPHSMLLTCGGEVDVPGSDAKAMAGVALSLGVPPLNILLEDQSTNTAQQAAAVKEIVGTDPFLLVTSASHMPRAVALFKAQGLAPIAAPTDFLAASPDHSRLSDWLPRLANMRKSHRAVYEWLATSVSKLRGRIPQHQERP